MMFENLINKFVSTVYWRKAQQVAIASKEFVYRLRHPYRNHNLMKVDGRNVRWNKHHFKKLWPFIYKQKNNWTLFGSYYFHNFDDENPV